MGSAMKPTPSMVLLDARIASFSSAGSSSSSTKSKGKSKSTAARSTFPLDPGTYPNLTPKYLADAGFFYAPEDTGNEESDTCQCFLCGLQLGGWDEEDDPFEEHVKRQNCPWAEFICSARLNRRKGVRATYDTAESLPSSSESSKWRAETFQKWWPHKQKSAWLPTVSNLSKAGFVYCPSSDSDDLVICPLCDYGVEGWEATDDPWTIHFTKSPLCDFFTARVTGADDAGTSYNQAPQKAKAGRRQTKRGKRATTATVPTSVPPESDAQSEAGPSEAASDVDARAALGVGKTGKATKEKKPRVTSRTRKKVETPVPADYTRDGEPHIEIEAAVSEDSKPKTKKRETKPRGGRKGKKSEEEMEVTDPPTESDAPDQDDEIDHTGGTTSQKERVHKPVKPTKARGKGRKTKAESAKPDRDDDGESKSEDVDELEEPEPKPEPIKEPKKRGRKPKAKPADPLPEPDAGDEAIIAPVLSTTTGHVKAQNVGRGRPEILGGETEKRTTRSASGKSQHSQKSGNSSRSRSRGKEQSRGDEIEQSSASASEVDNVEALEEIPDIMDEVEIQEDVIESAAESQVQSEVEPEESQAELESEVEPIGVDLADDDDDKPSRSKKVSKSKSKSKSKAKSKGQDISDPPSKGSKGSKSTKSSKSVKSSKPIAASEHQSQSQSSQRPAPSSQLDQFKNIPPSSPFPPTVHGTAAGTATGTDTGTATVRRPGPPGIDPENTPRPIPPSRPKSTLVSSKSLVPSPRTNLPRETLDKSVLEGAQAARKVMDDLVLNASVLRGSSPGADGRDGDSGTKEKGTGMGMGMDVDGEAEGQDDAVGLTDEQMKMTLEEMVRGEMKKRYESLRDEGEQMIQRWEEKTRMARKQIQSM